VLVYTLRGFRTGVRRQRAMSVDTPGPTYPPA
jgi:hypothetical protein